MSNKLFVQSNENDFGSRSPFVDVKELMNTPLTEVPTTAEEYLVSVMAERQNIKEVTQCDVDYKKYRRNQSLFYDQEPLPHIEDKLKPTKEWQNIQVADFSEVRSYISQMRKQTNKIDIVIKFEEKKKPDLRWWRYIFTKYDPTLSCVLGFNAAQIDNGLENLIKLMKLTEPGNAIDQYIGLWTYASLSCLKTPLQSDTVSILRDLAKQCWKLRSHIDPAHENAAELAAPLTLFICIVGRYFRQLDLADSID